MIPTTKAAPRDDRREAALARAAHGRELQVWTAQGRMIAAALKRPDMTFTSDDATPEGEEYADSAGWLGSAVHQLRNHRWIESVGFVRSARPSRKSNHVRLWRVTNAAAANEYLQRLRRLVRALTAAPPPVDDLPAGSLFDSAVNATPDAANVGRATK